MNDLSDHPTLSDLQKLIKQLVKERGFDNETVAECFMLFLEEAGEFAKATRRATGVKTNDLSKKHEVEEEAADVLWMLLDLCNRLGIDLEKAFRAKEVKNQQRTWN